MKCNKCNTTGFFRQTKRLAEVTDCIVRNFCIECTREFTVSEPKSMGIRDKNRD